MRDPQLFTPRILWAALLLSQAMYVGLLSFPGLRPMPTDPPDMIIAWGVGAAAVMVAIASFAVPALIRRSAAAAPPVDPHSGRSARQQAFGAALTPFILSMALSEAISIFGFILGWLGHSAFVWAPFITAGMLLSAWRFPTEARFFGSLTRTGVTVG
jgi:hypothetical protein